MNAFKLVVITTFLFLSSESRSDWEYTTYGMTADQIVAASAGKARMLSPAEQEGMSTAFGTAIAASTHQMGPFNFTVIFFADIGGSNLKTVRPQLQTKDESQTRKQVAELNNALTAKYGQEKDSQVEGGRFVTGKQWSWQGEADNVLLKYIDGVRNHWPDCRSGARQPCGQAGGAAGGIVRATAWL